jgi:N-carbamoylputrescine amidase
MTRPVTVAALQASLEDDAAANIRRMDELLRDAASRGAHIALMPELFESHYFPQGQREEHFERAREAASHPTLAHYREVAKKLELVLPVSFFEKSGPTYYNSLAVIDATGEILDVYRKSHIPDGPGYQEKFYFRPGNTGFRAVSTRYGRIGVAVCWDQWFPEAARALALDGADILFYPTAIGSEPQEPELDTRDPWQRVMIGHAVANSVGVVAANRTGPERDITFYGSSFIADHRGDKRAELGRDDEGCATATLDLDELQRARASFGFFRDRRPELYGELSRVTTKV